jgi:hypothetical protein
VDHNETETESDFPQEADYELRQAAMDNAYAEQYQRWVETLSEADLQRLTIDGLHEPDTTRCCSTTKGGGQIDLALVAGGAGGFENDNCVPTSPALTLEATDHDQLCELGLSAKQADAVLAWNSRRNADAVSDLAADRVAKFFALLMPTNTKHKINVQILGRRTLAAIFLLNRHGITSLSELAKRAGLSKQLLDFHTRRMEDALDFHGLGQKGIHTREVYSQAAKARWSALTPEERRARRAGMRGIVGTQSATDTAQI